jgi:IclR family acetate operon transcriptional repressor
MTEMKSEKGSVGSASGGPRAMTRVLRLFDLLARAPDGKTLTELSEALDVPKSTFLSSLRALTADGFLIAEGSTYRLGPGAYRLAGTIIASWSLPDVVRHHVRELGRKTSESVGFGIADWDIGQVIYTDAVNSTQPVHYAMRAGLRAPLYASAAGRVLLAYAPEEKRGEYMARVQFRALTPATRTTPESLAQSLEAVRRLGYCASFGELLRDTAAIAVPVFGSTQAIAGAMMVAAPLNRMRSNFEMMLDEVVRAGRLASGLAPDGAPEVDPEVYRQLR